MTETTPEEWEDQTLTEAIPPTRPVFVLANGIRVVFDVRYVEFMPGHGHVWVPIIEGELSKLLPDIRAFDAEVWPKACSILMPTIPGPIEEAKKWMKVIMANSPLLQRMSKLGGVGEIRRGPEIH